MSLEFDGVTIADWHHCSNIQFASPRIKNVSFPNSTGRGQVLYGSSNDEGTAIAITFSQGTDKQHNAMRASSVATINGVISNVLNKSLTQAKGTLSWAGGSYSNMRIVPGSFQVQGDPVPYKQGAATYYMLSFSISFSQYPDT